tara:strand:+ start:3803 stop:5374 length:1572 start_codon:yes stop_codon:yes gene_type:complete
MQKKRLTKKGQDPRSNKVSIYTSTYNSDLELLEEVFYKIKNQTHRDWEWIIFDDSTVEWVWPKLIEFTKLDARVKPITYKRQDVDDKHIVIDNRSDNKVGYTKKICCEHAIGKFLLELDHDDFLSKDALETIVKASKAYPKAGFFYSDAVEVSPNFSEFKQYPDYWGQGFGAHYWYWDDKHNVYALASRYPDINFTTLSHIVGIPNHVRVWTRDAYEKAGGYNSDYPVCDDYELFLRTVLAGVEIVKIPKILYYQHIHKNQTQKGTKPLIRQLTEQIWKQYKDDIQKMFPGDVVDQTNSFEYYLPNARINKIYTPNKKRVSVIMPTFQRPQYLIKAIESVLNQSYKEIELIVVGDNCPTIDRVMRDWFRGQTKIKWFNLEENYGAGGATPRNYALKHLATGDYITYMDDDNTLKKSHIKDLVKAMKGVDYAFTDMNMDGKRLKCREPKRYRIDTSSIMHKKELLEKYGYWKNRKEAGYAHDWELVSRWKDHKYCPTGKATLNYNLEFSEQDIDGIFNAYNDQE